MLVKQEKYLFDWFSVLIVDWSAATFQLVVKWILAIAVHDALDH